MLFRRESPKPKPNSPRRTRLSNAPRTERPARSPSECTSTSWVRTPPREVRAVQGGDRAGRPRGCPDANGLGLRSLAMGSRRSRHGNMPTRVAVVGAAASGKSTVAQRLAKALDVPYVYPGALLRDAAYDNPTELGIEAKRYLDSTKTVPDDFMMTLVKDRLGRDDCVVRGWILDGFPHNHYQAKALLDAGHEPDKVCVVEIDHETVFAWTRGRLIDPSRAGCSTRSLRRATSWRRARRLRSD